MDTVLVSAFGALLRHYRIAAGLSQEELAERASISRRSISDMERGVPHRPRHETVALLAEALLLSQDDRGAFVEAARRLHGQPTLPAPTLAHAGAALRAAPPFVGPSCLDRMIKRG